MSGRWVDASAGRGATRAGRRVWPETGLVSGRPRRGSARVMARRGAGRACQVRRACGVRQRRGPDGAARIEHCRRRRRRLVVGRVCLIGRLARVRRTCLLGGHARARLRAAGRLRRMCRGRRFHQQARLDGDRIPDRRRLPGNGRRDRCGLHRDRIPDRSRLPRLWRAMAARGRPARVRTGWRHGRVCRMLLAALPRCPGLTVRVRAVVRGRRPGTVGA